MQNNSKIQKISKFISKNFLWLLGALVIGFSIIWFVLWSILSSKTSELVDGLIADLAGNGIQVSCSERKNSGFPFSIVVSCLSPEVRNIGEISLINGEKLTASTSVFTAGSFVFEVVSPVSFQIGSIDSEKAIFDWDKAQLLVSTKQASIDEIAVNFESVIAKSASENPDLEYQLGQFALNLTGLIEQSESGMDLTLEIGDLNVGDLEFTMDRAVVDVSIRMPKNESSPEIGIFEQTSQFITNGGKIHVKQIGFDSMGVETNFGGEVEMHSNGLLSGKTYLWISGIDSLLSFADRYASENIMQFADTISGILAVIPEKERDGKSGVEIPITIKNGKVRVGFIPIGTIPPLLLLLSNSI